MDNLRECFRCGKPQARIVYKLMDGILFYKVVCGCGNEQLGYFDSVEKAKSCWNARTNPNPEWEVNQ